MTHSLLTTDHLNKLANAGDISTSADANGRGLDEATLDYARLDRAQQFFEDVGVEILTVLFLAALPEAYLGVRGVQVLDMTGALENDWTNRIRRTGQYLINILTHIHPFGFEQTKTVHQDSVATATDRIRGIHRNIRAELVAPTLVTDRSADFQGLSPLATSDAPSNRWTDRMRLMDLDASPSLPLNQVDLLGTLGTFTTVTFDALKKLGIAWTDEQRDDYYYFWNVIGWYLGIGDAATCGDAGVPAIAGRSAGDLWPDNILFPLTADEIDNIYRDISKQQQGPSEQGQVLAKVLVEELSYPLPGRLRDAPAFLIRYLIGDKKADDLQIDQGGYGDLLIRRSTLLGRVANWSGSSPIVALGVGPLSRMVTRYTLRTFLWSTRGQGGFTIDPRVAEKWRIQPPPESV